jgi:hypothetical protein
VSSRECSFLQVVSNGMTGCNLCPPFFWICLAIKFCRIAHPRIYLGASKAHKNNGNLFVNSLNNQCGTLRSNQPFGSRLGQAGMFGLRLTQVQSNIVDMHPHIISPFVRELFKSLQKGGSSCCSMDGMGAPLPKLLWIRKYTICRKNMKVER